MSVDKTNVVDICAVHPHRDEVLLIIIDHLDWKRAFEHEHLSMLQAKIYRYLDFVESGQLYDEFPMAKGKGITVLVRGVYKRSREAIKFYDAVARMVEQLGIRLRFDRAR